MSRSVCWEMQGQIAAIKLNHPPVNAINGKLLIDFNHCLNEIERQETVKAMVLMSTSEVIFATSASKKETGNKEDGEINRKLFFEIINKIRTLPFPAIAIVSGLALEEGFELALACDYRLATKSARFGFLNGSSPTKFGKSSLVSLIGQEKANEVIELGKIYGGIEAKRIGIVDRLIGTKHLLSEGMEMEKLVNSQLGKAMKLDKRFWQCSLSAR